MLVEFTDLDGDAVWINPHTVALVLVNPAGQTEIYSDYAAFVVQETCPEVGEALNHAMTMEAEC